MHYDAMKKYLAYFGSRASNNIVNYGLGDWFDIGPRHPGVAQLTPIALTATAFYFQDAEIMSRAAALLGKTDDAKEFSDLAGNIRVAFNEKFYDATNHFFATDSQTRIRSRSSWVFANQRTGRPFRMRLSRDVRKRGNALTAGDVGYRYLLRALADGGRSDVIFDINNQSGKPGYGMQLAKGATSLTEAWDAGRDCRKIISCSARSRNGFTTTSPASRTRPAARVQKDHYPSAARRRRDVGEGQLQFPPRKDCERMEARWRKIYLESFNPGEHDRDDLCSGQSADAVAKIVGATLLRMENGRAVFAVESGNYAFTSRQCQLRRSIFRWPFSRADSRRGCGPSRKKSPNHSCWSRAGRFWRTN